MKKRYRTHLFIILFLLVCPHAITFADSRSTEVSATVNPVYSFSIPADSAIPYGQTQTPLGQFSILDLLLYEGETLTIEATGGPLRRGASGPALPYTLRFDPPDTIAEADIGKGFDVSIGIAPADFFAARSGTYRGETVLIEDEKGGKVFFEGAELRSGWRAIRESPLRRSG